VGANLGTALAHLRANAPRSEIIVMPYDTPIYVVELNVGPAGEPAQRGYRAAGGALGCPPGERIPCYRWESCVSKRIPGRLWTDRDVRPAGRDIHANDTGYALIAGQFLAASRSSQLD
jgi:hypothetical protein